jgi:hypothetical protein
MKLKDFGRMARTASDQENNETRQAKARPVASGFVAVRPPSDESFGAPKESVRAPGSLRGEARSAPAVEVTYFGAASFGFEVSKPRLSVANYVPGTPVTALVKRPVLGADGEPKLNKDGSVVLTKVPIDAVLKGHAPDGRAVVQSETSGKRERFFVGWNAVTPKLAEGQTLEAMKEQGASHEMLLRGIGSAQILTPSPRTLEALGRALDRKVVGEHTAREFADALMRDGHQVALVGGAIRDVLYVLKQNPNAPLDQLLECFKDLDFVTTATPSQVRAICEQISPEDPKGHVWTPDSIDRFGVVGVGVRKSGIDIASFRVGLSDRRGSVLGKTILDDADGRDFSVNQLTLVLGSNQIIDPTGRGATDAESKTLSPNMKDMLKNDMLSLRYFKFRERGFHGSTEALKAMRTHAEAIFPKLVQSDGKRFINNVLRIAPGSCTDRASLEAYLARISQVMNEDGMGDLYSTYFTPERVDALAAEVIARNTEAA